VCHRIAGDEDVLHRMIQDAGRRTRATSGNQQNDEGQSPHMRSYGRGCRKLSTASMNIRG